MTAETHCYQETTDEYEIKQSGTISRGSLKIDGFVRLQCKNGNLYEMFYRDGEPHGYARSIYPNGEAFECIYEHGKLVTKQQIGKLSRRLHNALSSSLEKDLDGS